MKKDWSKVVSTELPSFLKYNETYPAFSNGRTLRGVRHRFSVIVNFSTCDGYLYLFRLVPNRFIRIRASVLTSSLKFMFPRVIVCDLKK